jgi:protein tyrosine/serine phosphatase
MTSGKNLLCLVWAVRQAFNDGVEVFMRNLFACSVFFFVFFALANDLPPNIYNFSDGQIFRGPMPDLITIQRMKDLGIKTILNLDNNKAAIANERKIAANLGIDYISKPMSGFWAPQKSYAKSIVAMVNDPALYPIFVHCKHGQDRTGLILGLYRVYYQHWRPADAYQEMLDYGFHPILFLLKHSYKELSRWDD